MQISLFLCELNVLNITIKVFALKNLYQLQNIHTTILMKGHCFMIPIYIYRIRYILTPFITQVRMDRF